MGGGGCRWETKKAWQEDGYSQDEEGEPFCYGNYYTADNHLSGAATSPFSGGAANVYYWKVPDWIPDGSVCVLRLRYNITAVDFIDFQKGNKKWDREYVDDSDGRVALDKNRKRETGNLDDMYNNFDSDWYTEIDHRFNKYAKSILQDDPELDTLKLGEFAHGACIQVKIPDSGGQRCRVVFYA